MLQKRSIWDEMKKMQDRMDAMFDSFFRSDDLVEDKSKEYRRAIANTRETNKEYITEIEIPGIDKKDINVSVTDNGIEVKAESKSEIKDKDKLEKSYVKFYRHVSLPKNVDPNKANAEYKNGVLKITVPKLKIEQKKKKLLEIK